MRDFDKLSKRRQARIKRRAEKAGISVEEFRNERRKKVVDVLKKILSTIAGLTPTDIDNKISSALGSKSLSEAIDDIDDIHDDDD